MTDPHLDPREYDRVAALVAVVARSHGFPASFRFEDSLLDGGMTSMAMVDLMLAVEQEFDVLIPNHELSPSNFFSIAALANMITRLSVSVYTERPMLGEALT